MSFLFPAAGPHSGSPVKVCHRTKALAKYYKAILGAVVIKAQSESRPSFQSSLVILSYDILMSRLSQSETFFDLTND